jgi:ketosteroid isomerase-like protein
MFDPYQFAREWTEAWSRRDAEAVLAHYADDAVFTSPKAQTIAGKARLANKAELAAYWRAAVERIPRIHFDLEHAYWDEAKRTLTVVYLADLAGTKMRASEIMRFDDRGTVVEGEAFYGANVS